jgi:hypothetical protein
VLAGLSPSVFLVHGLKAIGSRQRPAADHGEVKNACWLPSQKETFQWKQPTAGKTHVEGVLLKAKVMAQSASGAALHTHFVHNGRFECDSLPLPWRDTNCNWLLHVRFSMRLPDVRAE